MKLNSMSMTAHGRRNAFDWTDDAMTVFICALNKPIVRTHVLVILVGASWCCNKHAEDTVIGERVNEMG